jgi:uncharacterized protein
MPDVPPPECWLSPAVEVRPSPIHGRGLFARAVIRADAVVSRLGGCLVTEAGLRRAFRSAAEQPGPPYIDTITVGEDTHLILPAGSPNGAGNHGCDPNLWWTDAFTLVARRTVRPGEELTNDYGTSTGLADFRMPCRCGSPLCRGTVTGDDWRRRDLRDRYGDHWIPILLARIQASPPAA